jgi:hypothetical protein
MVQIFKHVRMKNEQQSFQILSETTFMISNLAEVCFLQDNESRREARVCVCVRFSSGRGREESNELLSGVEYKLAALTGSSPQLQAVHEGQR